MPGIEKIVLIGAGNVATHMGMALKAAGCSILQVYSRTASKASALAHRMQCPHTTEMQDILPGADLYIFSVADQALPALMDAFPLRNVFVVHTSGSTPMDVMARPELCYGVFYPLQTFSSQVEIDFRQVPLCLEAGQEQHLQQLEKLAGRISSQVQRVNSQQRIILHVAAVFACNFTNHLYAIADDILQKSGMDLSLLYPLMEETLRKAGSNPPARVQTGPAVRGDHETMQKHLAKLEALPDYQNIYTFISQSIIKASEQKS